MSENLSKADMALVAEIEGVPSSDGVEENLYELFKKFGSNNIHCIFADTSAGKTRFSTQIALDARKKGVNVTFWDTENGLGNVATAAIQRAGVKRISRTDYTDFTDEVATREQKGLIIVDSATLFITGNWLKTKNTGILHGRLQSMCERAKLWADKNDSMVIMIAQPKSMMVLDSSQDKYLAPMGDKWGFYAKTVFYLELAHREDGKIMRRTLKIYKSRDVEDGTVLTDFKTTSVGVELIDWDGAWGTLDF